MRPPSTFTTCRLFLRIPVQEDAEAIFHSYAQDPAVTRYLMWRPHAHLETTRVFINNCISAWQQASEFPYVITTRANQHLIGMISLRISGFAASLGYVLTRDAWGQGIMAEAAATIIEWALAQPSIYRVWAICDHENVASARVLEKIGMLREGLMRRGTLHPNVSEEPRDCWLYAKTK